MFTLILTLLTALFSTGPATPAANLAIPATHLTACSPDYYSIKLVTTRKVTGARLATGKGEVTYASSPFGVSISENGSYVQNIDIQVEKVKLAEGSSLVAWITTPQLDQIKPIGRLDDTFHVSGQTDWNKFLLVITLEPANEELGDMWTGPVVVRGMSRSGLMHTKAGHGPFETEPCAVYGY
ncbi:MAG: hypothetical protein O3A57_09840 [Bacteroidetes bacterium]|nr:hypothetical protein [Bacteroidota bacterium]